MKNFTTQKGRADSNTSAKIGYARLFAVCVAFSLGAFFTTHPASASDKSAEILVENSSQLEQIENYLNDIHNLSARFVQQSPEGGKAEGKLFLSRSKNTSGKMRIEYTTDPKVIITVNGSTLSYYDVELDETSQLSTNTTPASLLTRPNISFSAKDVELTSVTSDDNFVKVSLMKKNRKEAGEFSLIFKTNPLEFMKMEVKDDLGQVVRVTLSNMDFHSAIPHQKFAIK